MRKLFSLLFYSWLVISLAIAGVSLYTTTAIVWLGVILTAGAPLLNRFWRYDSDNSVHAKVKLPMVSLLVFAGVALVLLTVAERGLPLWLCLGSLGGFLLNTYWASERDG